MITQQKLSWDRESVPAELHDMLEVIGEEYPVSEGKGGDIRIVFQQGAPSDELRVRKQGESSVVVEYGASHLAARGLGLALAGVESNEKSGFRTFGVLISCGHTSVMNIKHLKKWLRRLALLGYNMVMLYTKDAYELPGEPYFGYMRGAYTLAEMKEIDDFARRLGIEMIGCIQTLGHLEPVLHWSDYIKVRDTMEILLVDQDETYKLIEKMISFWSEAFHSRRIHIGMDECQGLGRGKFMDKFGYERSFDIFNRHLARVCKICEQQRLKPMIWSDMYFRMGSKNMDYYDREGVIPDDVKKKIPATVDLVYWDYDKRDKEFYKEWIKRHRDLGHEPLMASCIHTAAKWWYDHDITTATVKPCLEACRETGLGEIFFTLWGNDGSYCEFDSALAGLCWAAELSCGADGDQERLEKIFRAVCGGSYQAQVLASNLNMCDHRGEHFEISAASLVWDDPLMAKYIREIRKKGADMPEKLLEYYRDLHSKLLPYEHDKGAGEIAFALRAAELIIAKIEFRLQLEKVYAGRDQSALRQLSGPGSKGVLDACHSFAAAFRTQWLRRNKPFGLDVIQFRLGGLVARYNEAKCLLAELAAGERENIPELDVKMDFLPGAQPEGGYWKNWALSDFRVR